MRAPTDNERIVKQKWYKYSGNNYAEGYDRLFNKCYSCTVCDNTITVEASISGISRLPLMKYTVVYTFYGDGSVKVALNGDIRETAIWLPRLGFEFKTPYDNDKFMYFGRDDGEN